jgi:hypothetical protein
MLVRPVGAQTARPGDVSALLDRYLTTYDDRLQRLLSDAGGVRPGDAHRSLTVERVSGEATSANFRRFETSGRVVR